MRNLKFKISLILLSLPTLIVSAQKNVIRYGTQKSLIYPIPKEYKEFGSKIKITNSAVIAIGNKASLTETTAANWFQKMLQQRFSLNVQVVKENAIPASSNLIFVAGQKSTNKLVAKQVKSNKINVPTAKKEYDSYTVNSIKKGSKTYVVISGRNERGVSYGITACYDLITLDGAVANFHPANIRDWAVYENRRVMGFDNTAFLNHGKDAMMYQRWNQLIVNPDKKSNSETELLKETGMIGMKNMYKIKGHAKKKEHAAIFAEAEDAFKRGYKGLYLNFDDYGMGEDYVTFMTEIENLRAKYNIEPSAMMATTAPYGSTPPKNKVIAAMAKLPGEIKNYTYTLTILAHPDYNKDMVDNGTPNWQWWHNYWTKNAGGNGYVVLKNDGHYFQSFGALMHPKVGWSLKGLECTYENINKWAGNANGVTSLMSTRTHCAFNETPFSLIGWDPARVTWEDTQNKARASVFGDDAVEYIKRYEEIIMRFQQMFLQCGLAVAKKGMGSPWLLKATESKEESLKLIAEMRTLAKKIESIALKQSAYPNEVVQKYFLNNLHEQPDLYEILIKAPLPEKKQSKIRLAYEFVKIAKEQGDVAGQKAVDNFFAKNNKNFAIIKKRNKNFLMIDNYLKEWRGFKKLKAWKKYAKKDKSSKVAFIQKGKKLIIKGGKKGSKVYYTVDGKTPYVLDDPANTSKLYQKPLVLSKGTEIQAGVLDLSSNKLGPIFKHTIK